MADQKLVAVTGASGYVAGELIKQLQEKGYTVRGTVRSLKDEVKTKHLVDTFPNLKLFEADLLSPGSFDECFKGVHAVFHTASPFQLVVKDPQTELIDPAVNGTKNVLASVEKSLDTIKFVVVTSSVAAVIQQDTSNYPADKVWTEEDWNNTSSIDNGPYRLSKYLAEKAAWDIAKGKSYKLTTINPSFVMGPPISSRTDATSIATVVKLMSGGFKDGAAPSAFGVADVRNVAQAHIACIEKPEANGRYMITSEDGIPQLQLAKYLKDEFPDYPLPEKQNGELPNVPKMSNAKARKDLGIEFIPVKQSMVDMGHALIKFGLVKK